MVYRRDYHCVFHACTVLLVVPVTTMRSMARDKLNTSTFSSYQPHERGQLRPLAAASAAAAFAPGLNAAAEHLGFVVLPGTPWPTSGRSMQQASAANHAWPILVSTLCTTNHTCSVRASCSSASMAGSSRLGLGKLGPTHAPSLLQQAADYQE
jgi:hypothetical protein